MTEVHLLQLVQKPSTSKRDRYRYEVVKDGQVIATRHSNREYVACFVTRDNSGQYSLPNFFSRIDLIGRGGSSNTAPYAVAVVDEHRKTIEIESVLKVMFKSEKFQFVVSDTVDKVFI